MQTAKFALKANGAVIGDADHSGSAGLPVLVRDCLQEAACFSFLRKETFFWGLNFIQLSNLVSSVLKVEQFIYLYLNIGYVHAC